MVFRVVPDTLGYRHEERKLDRSPAFFRRTARNGGCAFNESASGDQHYSGNFCILILRVFS
jgi:hypothetical protein